MRDTDHRGTAIEFSTRSLFADEPATNEDGELVETLRELKIAFSASKMREAVVSLGIVDQAKTEAPTEPVLQALRAFCVLIIESDRPRLTAQLVGRLVKLDLAAGKRLKLSELARTNGISKQAASNRLGRYANALNLPRPDSSPEARESHRLMNRRNYGSRTNPPALAPH